MNSINKNLIDLKSTTEKELEAKEEMKKSILEDDKYISWLEHFSIDNPSFYNDDWLYYPERILEEDEEKVEKLYLLYEIVNDYAEKNCISATPIEFGNFYSIKHNNVAYEIGITVGQGIIFFCKRSENLENSIGFDDIKQNKPQNKINLINNRLETLSNLINNMLVEGIPIESITNITEKTTKKILTKKNRT